MGPFRWSLKWTAQIRDHFKGRNKLKPRGVGVQKCKNGPLGRVWDPPDPDKNNLESQLKILIPV